MQRKVSQMTKINLNDLIKLGNLDLSKITRIKIVPTQRNTFYNELASLTSFVVDSEHKTIKFLRTNSEGAETTVDENGHETVVARVAGDKIEFLSHTTDEPYAALSNPITTDIPENANADIYLLVAFREYVRTAYYELFSGKAASVDVEYEGASPIPDPEVVAVNSISFNEGDADKQVNLGSEFTITPMVNPSNATNKNLSISSDNAGSVSQSGFDESTGTYKFSAKADGVANLTWNATDGSNVSVTSKVTVITV